MLLNTLKNEKLKKKTKKNTEGQVLLFLFLGFIGWVF